ncbi:DUF308 domain-containing protein [Streptomyces ficellus]|uniref:Uncharacterized protein n=1 Tax=Streptomyces ficellus TaxID=1977088 RepID=A0A6I6F380_9ACTN|nr:hypothetical protein EIZ62_02525 [Streptomyces ficellus]
MSRRARRGTAGDPRAPRPPSRRHGPARRGGPVPPHERAWKSQDRAVRSRASRPGREDQPEDRSEGRPLGAALATLAPGVLILVWPDGTLHVLALLVGLCLLVTGAFRFVGRGGWRRAGPRPLTGRTAAVCRR